MIFGRQELPLLNRIVVRKGCEIATATFDQSLDETQRRMKVDGFVRQINRARVITAVTSNDVSRLDLQLKLFEESGDVLPPAMSRDYLAGLSAQEFGDEAHFLGLQQEFEAQLPFMREACRIADEEGSDCTVGDSDVVIVRSVRDTMSKMLDRFDGQDAEVLGDAARYARTISEMCSVLLRISSLKPVSSVEISDVCRGLGEVSEDDFDRLAEGVLDRREGDALAAFRSNTARYVPAMYARCVLNARCPQVDDIDGMPVARARPVAP